AVPTEETPTAGATLATQGTLTVSADDQTAVSMVVGAAASGNTLGVGLSGAKADIGRAVEASVGDADVAAKGLDGGSVTAPNGVALQATTADNLLSYAAGQASANDLGLAASAVYNQVGGTTTAFVGPGATVNGSNGDASTNQVVRVLANHSSDVLSVAGSFAG